MSNNFSHYHNGQLFEQYSNIGDRLPHAFFGWLVVKPVVKGGV